LEIKDLTPGQYYDVTLSLRSGEKVRTRGELKVGKQGKYLLTHNSPKRVWGSGTKVTKVTKAAKAAKTH
jgi:hypothetical protein